MIADGAVLAYDGFEPDQEGLREALTSTGNGYFCTRGAALLHVWLSVQAALINGPADRAIDRALRIVLLILVLSPAARVWSVDARLATGSFRGDRGPAPAWRRSSTAARPGS